MTHTLRPIASGRWACAARKSRSSLVAAIVVIVCGCAPDAHRSPTPDPAPAPAASSITFAATVQFDHGSAVLGATAIAKLQNLCAVLTRVAARFGVEAFLVEGHADGIEARDNAQLSAARADAVGSFLVECGYRPESVRTTALGATRPVARETVDGLDDPAGRAKNRRVEVEVVRAPRRGGPDPAERLF